MAAPGGDGTSAVARNLCPATTTPRRRFSTREKNLIFAQEWFRAGREEELRAGNYKGAGSGGREHSRRSNGEGRAEGSLQRVPPQKARGFARRRKIPSGMRRVAGGVMPSGSIRCPYHQWTYSLEGELLGAPFLKDARRASAKEDFSLLSRRGGRLGRFFLPELESERRADTQRSVPFSTRGCGPKSCALSTRGTSNGPQHHL